MKKIRIALILVIALCLNFLALTGCNQDKHQQTDFMPETDAEGEVVTDEKGEISTPGGQEQQTDEKGEVVTQPKVRYEGIPENGYDGSEVTITFYHTMGQNLRDVLDKYIEKFNEMYPNITIEHSQIGNYDDVRDTIKTELTAGNQPNIAYCYPDHVALYNITKKVVPLDNFIESKIPTIDALGNESILGLTDEQIADFVPGFYKEGTAFDAARTMYTLPMSKSTEVLYYNATFFKQHNLQVPKTWEEMEALCAQIKAIDPNCIPLGYDSEANWFITMCEQQGSPYTSTERGKNFLFNNDANKAFVKEFRSWYEAGYLTTQEIYGAYTSGLFVNQDTSTPRSYMSIGSSAGATHQRPAKVDGAYPFEVGIASVPQVDPSNPKVISQGPSLCIFDSENKQEVVASWLFVEFLTTSSAFQAEFSIASGYMPVIKSANDIPVYQDFIAKANGGDYVAALSVKVANEQSDAYYVSPAFNGSSAARDQVGKLLQYCMVTQTTDVDALLNEAFKQAVEECKKAQ